MKPTFEKQKETFEKKCKTQTEVSPNYLDQQTVGKFGDGGAVVCGAPLTP